MIYLSGINKIYKGSGVSFQALTNIDLQVEEGEFVTIVGQSGSGKSTLLNIIGLLDDYDSGDYIFEGKNVSSIKPGKLTKWRLTKFGFVFQSFHLLSYLTALENVELPMGYNGVSSAIRRRKAEEMLIKVGLGSKLHNKPGQLSGGEQQRVAVARALINSPRLLLADEPTGNLDSKNSEKILDLLYDLNKEGLTVLMVTHDQNLISRSNKIYTLKDGQFI